MSPSPHALWRLYWIDAILQRGAEPNATHLAHQIGISRSTVQRDLERLRQEFKAPITFDPPDRGYRYASGSSPELPELPLEEALELGRRLRATGDLGDCALARLMNRRLNELLDLVPAAGLDAPGPAPSAEGAARVPESPRARRTRLGQSAGLPAAPRKAPVSVVLRFDRVAALELFKAGALRREEVQFLTDGGFETSVSTRDPDALLLELLRWAPHFEIARPAWIRRRLPSLLRRLLRRWEPRPQRPRRRPTREA